MVRCRPPADCRGVFRNRSNDVSDSSADSNRPQPLDNDPERRARELTVIHAASTELHRLREPESLAHDLIGILGELMSHDFAAVYLVDGDRLVTFTVSDRGLGADVIEADRRYLDSLELRVGDGVTGWVARHGQTVRLGNAPADDRFLDSQPGVLSELCVPMRLRDKVVGVINLESKRPDAYSPSDARILEIVAAQIAIAIENANLFAQARQLKRLELLADLTGGIAHDLGNLQSIIASEVAALVERLPDDENNRRQLRQLRQAIDRAEELVGGLLRVGIAKHAPGGDIDVNALVRQAGALVAALVGDGVEIVTDLGDEPMRVRASRGELEQVLMNLVVNARQAMEGRGRLTLSTRLISIPPTADGTELSPGDYVRLDVADDGPGMDARTQRRALQPFFTTRPNGEGLGLNTVARVVRRLGGYFLLETAPGKGTVAGIMLPRATRVD